MRPAFSGKVRRSPTLEDIMIAGEKPAPQRYIGLDIHKRYLVAYGVDAHLEPQLGPRRVNYADLDRWIQTSLTPQDALVIEMTTNTWEMYDRLLPHVHSITVVHPPHVAMITRSQVMTDKIAARALAQLLAKGLLVGIWVPPEAVRQQRALVAHRNKFTRLTTQAKNRLHAVLHRRQILPPEKVDLFAPAQAAWWMSLPLDPVEKALVQTDLDTLAFGRKQIQQLETSLNQQAAQDERLPLLVQLPGVSVLTALTILAAIGEITRFPSAKHLVGYAGLGARIHDSGQTTRTGRITKAGRRDLRTGMVEAAQTAANTHPHWQAELARLEPRLGRNKAIVAIARKLLVAVWHILTQNTADRHAEAERLAYKFLQLAYTLGQENRPKGQTAAAFARKQLDRLGLGQHLTQVRWGAKKKPIPLPPSVPPQTTA
jgi:transposase